MISNAGLHLKRRLVRPIFGDIHALEELVEYLTQMIGESHIIHFENMASSQKMCLLPRLREHLIEQMEP
jgi:hypothetical protein